MKKLTLFILSFLLFGTSQAQALKFIKEQPLEIGSKFSFVNLYSNNEGYIFGSNGLYRVLFNRETETIEIKDRAADGLKNCLYFDVNLNNPNIIYFFNLQNSKNNVFDIDQNKFICSENKKLLENFGVTTKLNSFEYFFRDGLLVGRSRLFNQNTKSFHYYITYNDITSFNINRKVKMKSYSNYFSVNFNVSKTANYLSFFGRKGKDWMIDLYEVQSNLYYNLSSIPQSKLLKVLFYPNEKLIFVFGINHGKKGGITMHSFDIESKQKVKTVNLVNMDVHYHTHFYFTPDGKYFFIKKEGAVMIYDASEFLKYESPSEVKTRLANEMNQKYLQEKREYAQNKIQSAPNKNIELTNNNWVFLGTNQLNGMANGSGLAINKNGLEEITEGVFKDGEFVSGTMLVHDTLKLTGNYQNFKLHGQGRIDYADGSYYEGEFVDGILNGSGVQFTAGTKESYTGDFKEGVRHGYGVLEIDDISDSCEYHLGERIDKKYLGRKKKLEKSIVKEIKVPEIAGKWISNTGNSFDIAETEEGFKIINSTRHYAFFKKESLNCYSCYKGTGVYSKNFVGSKMSFTDASSIEFVVPAYKKTYLWRKKQEFIVEESGDLVVNGKKIAIIKKTRNGNMMIPTMPEFTIYDVHGKPYLLYERNKGKFVFLDDGTSYIPRQCDAHIGGNHGIADFIASEKLFTPEGFNKNYRAEFIKKYKGLNNSAEKIERIKTDPIEIISTDIVQSGSKIGSFHYSQLSQTFQEWRIYSLNEIVGKVVFVYGKYSLGEVKIYLKGNANAVYNESAYDNGSVLQNAVEWLVKNNHL